MSRIDRDAATKMGAWEILKRIAPEKAQELVSLLCPADIKLDEKDSYITEVIMRLPELDQSIIKVESSPAHDFPGKPSFYYDVYVSVMNVSALKNIFKVAELGEPEVIDWDNKKGKGDLEIRSNYHAFRLFVKEAVRSSSDGY